MNFFHVVHSQGFNGGFSCERNTGAQRMATGPGVGGGEIGHDSPEFENKAYNICRPGRCTILNFGKLFFQES